MFARFREVVDWRFVLSSAFLILVVQLGFNSWSDSRHNDRLVRQLETVTKVAASDRKEASEERAVLVEGQRQLRRDYQLLLDYLESVGVAVPPNLARAITLGGSGRDNDDDDGDTNITVLPETRTTTPAPSSSSSGGSGSPSPTPDEGEPNLTDVVPDLPLPGPVGEATDTAKRIVDDLPEMLPIQ